MNFLETVDSKALEAVVTSLSPIVDNPANFNQGLCFYVTLRCPTPLAKQCSLALAYLCSQWPEYSGCLGYPVPCPDGGCPEDAFDNAEGMYNGPYGESRLRLAQFMIDECNKELNRRSTQC